jgi:hypothetical protein
VNSTDLGLQEGYIDDMSLELEDNLMDDTELEMEQDHTNNLELELELELEMEMEMELNEDYTNDLELELEEDYTDDLELELGEDYTNDLELELALEEDYTNDLELELEEDDTNDLELELELEKDYMNDLELELEEDYMNGLDLEGSFISNTGLDQQEESNDQLSQQSLAMTDVEKLELYRGVYPIQPLTREMYSLLQDILYWERAHLYTAKRSPLLHANTPCYLHNLPYDILERVIRYLDHVSLYMLRQSSPFFFRSSSAIALSDSSSATAVSISSLNSFPYITHRTLFLPERIRAATLLCKVLPCSCCRHSRDPNDWTA